MGGFVLIAPTLAIGRQPERTARARNCELCGAGDFQLLASRDRQTRPLATALCRCCGLIAHRDLPTDEELGDYYADQYRRDYHGEGQPSPRRVLRAWHDGEAIFHRLKPFVRRHDSVFEIGAGLGCTLKTFELAGHKATGIDPGAEFQAYSRQTLRAQVENLQLADLPPIPSYDVILLVHVIEHFNHPMRALRHLRNLLRPGGRLYVECPNIAAPHAAPARLFHYAHIYNFTSWTLRMMADCCGLRIIRQFSRPRDHNLSLLLHKADPRPLVIDPTSYERSLAAVRRYNTLTYHCRPCYAVERLQSLYRLAGSRWFARRRVARLIARFSSNSQCDASSQQTGNLPPLGRRAA